MEEAIAKASEEIDQEETFSPDDEELEINGMMILVMDSLWNNIDYWEGRPHLSLRKKLEAVVFSTLCILDGVADPFVRFKLVAQNEEFTVGVELEDLHEFFYGGLEEPCESPGKTD